MIIFSAVSLSAQTGESIEVENTQSYQKYVAISPLIAPRLCLGIMKPHLRQENRYFESIYYIHGFDTFSKEKIYGISYRLNAFVKRDTRLGLYLLSNLGVDYIQARLITPFGLADDETKSRLFINAAAGLGYSFEFKDDSYLRFELDVGWKLIFSNFYITYIW